MNKRLTTLIILSIVYFVLLIIYQREKYWIDQYKNNGYKLTNLKDGGYNPSGYKLKPLSEEVKKRMSNTLKIFWEQIHQKISLEF